MKLCLLKTYTNHSLANLRKGKYTHLSGVDFADMQVISKFNKGFRFLLCAVDIYSKCSWVIPLKDKNVLPALMFFKTF